MNPCFVCGCDWVCKHREPELVAHEYQIRRALFLLEERASQPLVVSRKPPARASNGTASIPKAKIQRA